MIRGLIDKVKDGATVRYHASTDTYRFMGVSSQQELPDFGVVQAKVSEILARKVEEEKTEEEPAEKVTEDVSEQESEN